MKEILEKNDMITYSLEGFHYEVNKIKENVKIVESLRREVKE